MSASSRTKGATYERSVLTWLKSKGWIYAERRIAGMADDRGDINGLPGVVIEAKNRKRFELAAYMDQLVAEIHTAGADTGVCIVKRAGVTDVGHHYAVMPADLWADLMVEAGRGAKPVPA